MRNLFLLLSCFALILSAQQVNAQCADGETEISISVTTDNYGSETSWTLKDASGTVLVSGSGYVDGNNDTDTKTTCVIEGDYTFEVLDTYGDGMCCAWGTGGYSISAGGQIIASGGEFGTSDEQQFSIATPTLDMVMLNVASADNVVLGHASKIEAYFQNRGLTTVTSFDLNWRTAAGGATNTDSYSGLNLTIGTRETFTHSILWLPETVGSTSMEVWISNINGGEDENEANNTVTSDINVFVPERTTLVEFFTNASCGPCAAQIPILSSNMNACDGYAIGVAYHTSWPGTDPMYTHNTSEADTRVGYYNVQGVPDAFHNGTDLSATTVSSSLMYAAATTESNVTISNAVAYIKADGELEARADVTVDAALSGDIRVHIIAVEELVEFASPPGNNGEKEFGWVMKKMLTTATGDQVGDFAMGETKTSTGVWMPANVYEEEELKVVVFVQNHSTKEVFQAQIVELGDVVLAADDLKEGPSFVMFPNPASDVLSLAFDFDDAKDLNIQVTNTLGQTMKNMTLRNVGNEKITLNVNDLANGIYFLNVERNGLLTTKRFVVSK